MPQEKHTSSPSSLGKMTLDETRHALYNTHMAWMMLYLLFGFMLLLSGIDKFFNIVIDWPRYLSPLALQVIPLTAMQFMWIVGGIEIVLGIVVFAKPKVGGVLAGIWILLIAINLLTLLSYSVNYADIALRDVGLAIAALALASLSADTYYFSLNEPL